MPPITALNHLPLNLHSANFWIANLFAFLVGYFIGHLIFAKLIMIFLHIPVHKYYSKNLGATNVARVGGIPLGFVTFLFDMTKTVVTTYFFLLLKLETNFFQSSIFFLAACGVFFGHCLPILFRFRGGKGLSCLAGMVIVYNPYLGALLIVYYMFFSLLFKNSIFAMILTMIAVIWCLFIPKVFPFYLEKFYHPDGPMYLNAALLCICCACSIVFHRTNFIQLLKNPRKPSVNPLYYRQLIRKISRKTIWKKS